MRIGHCQLGLNTGRFYTCQPFLNGLILMIVM